MRWSGPRSGYVERNGARKNELIERVAPRGSVDLPREEPLVSTKLTKAALGALHRKNPDLRLDFRLTETPYGTRPIALREAHMDKYVHQENLALYKKRLEEPRTDAERRVLLKLLAEEEAKGLPPKEEK
jgi:hypothetical protein